MPDAPTSSAPTRDRIMEGTARLFGLQGYAGTGLKQIAETAGAPYGSIYHFFPGGKRQLGEEVVRWSGGIYEHVVAAVYDAEADAIAATRAIFAGAADVLVATNWETACPIATVALEVSSVDDRLREACADVFSGWIGALTERYVAHGIEPERAASLALIVLAQLEGGFLLCQTLRDRQALDAAADLAETLVRRAMAN